jgi:hypothetical protein
MAESFDILKNEGADYGYYRILAMPNSIPCLLAQVGGRMML